jgi:cell fate regulator YaaT (PSP1 superfamily)
MTDQLLDKQRTVAGVRFQRVGKLYHFEYDEYPQLQAGDYVIVETTRGRQMGEVVNFYAVDEENREYKPILRMASPRDLILRHHWELQQDDAMNIVKQKVREQGGIRDAKFITALYNYDGTLLTIIYTAEDKVNVNKLWGELTKAFPHAQVEMRQVGPRDVAKLLGGFGACGELRCCSTFLTDFSPVSIKMAKAQGISLNPSEITGMCGRLRCCLVYEYEQYVQARQHLPKKNKRIGTPHGEGRVIDVMPLQDAVLVAVGDGLQVVKREEIVPLEELEAIAKKAKEPCDKHEGGGCDCGAQDGHATDERPTEAKADDQPLAGDIAQEGESAEEDDSE